MQDAVASMHRGGQIVKAFAKKFLLGRVMARFEALMADFTRSRRMPDNLLIQHGILTRAQLAVLLDVQQETIARWEEEHDFPGRKAGKMTLYDIAEIKKWIAEGKAKARG